MWWIIVCKHLESLDTNVIAMSVTQLELAQLQPLDTEAVALDAVHY